MVGTGYGLGAFGLMLFNLTVSIFLLYFYTDVVGLSSRVAGYILFVAMFWDAVTDPIMGVVADRTHTRWGKYRPYLIFATPALFVAFLGLFFVPDLSPTLTTAYAVATTLTYRTLVTIVWMPFTAMIPAITSDYGQRSSLTAYKTVFTSLGGIAVSSSVLFLVEALGNGNETRGFFLSSIIVGTLACAGIWTCVAMTREQPRDASPGNLQFDSTQSRISRNHYSARQFVESVLQNRPFIVLFSASFVLLVAWNCLWQTTVYYFKYCVGHAESASVALTGFHVLQAVAAPVWARVTAFAGKRTVWIIGSLISAASLMFLFPMANPSEELAIALVSVFGIGTSAFLVTYYSALADTVDFGEVQSGVRFEALLFGSLAFAQKISFGVASAVVGNALSWIGFEPNVAQSEATLNGVRSIFALVPSLGFILSVLIIAFYSLDQSSHSSLIRQLQARRATGKTT